MNDALFPVDRRDMLALAGALTGATVLGCATSGEAQAAEVSLLGRDMPFDSGWRFHRGEGQGFEAAGFDDQGWRRIDLPHDWSIEDVPGGAAPGQLGPFDKTSRGGTATGFAVGGEGWYRKHFRVDHAPRDARIEVLFDGIYEHSDVWLNGQLLGSNVNGYRPFAIDLTPALDRGGDNVLAVRVRNLGQNSRWYSGSGIYRQVKLEILPAGARIARWGVAAWTRAIEQGIAHVDVTTRLEAADPTLELVTRLRDPQGMVAAEKRSAASAEVIQRLAVRAPHLWSPDNPALYSLETELRRGDAIVDRIVQHCGIRIVTMDPLLGMTINGRPTRLRGGCIHHDNGLLGACAYPDADARRIRLLKARGYNAIRSSHNIPSRSLREACDRLGMLLIAEAFDAWHWPKLPQDFSTQFDDHWHEVIEAMVLSGRNSPSIIMWSIGNEIPSRSSDEGVAWSWQLANAVRRLDPTRPVTEALNGVLGGPMIADEATARPNMAGKSDNASTIFLDVPGYNYRLDDIESEHATHPERVVYASETFPRDAHDYQALAERAPYFMGEFVWTAMDYLGEAGVGATAQIKGNVPYYMAGWPWVVSWCGDIDLIGRQKPPSLARDVVWGMSPLEMAVQRPLPEGMHEFIAQWGWPDELPSWTWAGAEGKPLTVRIYSSAEHVELRLNGRKIGEHAFSPSDKMRCEISVPYAAGVLEAWAWRNGKTIARRRLETVGPAARLRIVPETGPKSGRQILHYVGLEIIDAQGRLLSEDERKIELSITGPAELIAFGSANPHAKGSFQSHEAQSFRGRALAILRSTGATGSVQVMARCAGLQGGMADLPIV